MRGGNICGGGLKITFLLAVFHRGFGPLVIGSVSTLGLAGGGDFLDDFLHRVSVAFDRAGDSGISHGAETDHLSFDRLPFTRLDKFRDGENDAIPSNGIAFMRIVETGELDPLLLHIHPDVHFREVGERENTKIFSWLFTTIEKVPQLGALVFGIPFAEVIAVGEEAFFRARFFLITATSSEDRIVLLFFDRL